jgi:hypothetical protein
VAQFEIHFAHTHDDVGRHGGVHFLASHNNKKGEFNRYTTERGWILDWIDRQGDHGYRLNYRKANNFNDSSHVARIYGRDMANPAKIWTIRYEQNKNEWSFAADGVVLFREVANKIPSNGSVYFYALLRK